MKSVTKKILALLLAVLMVLPLVACGEITDDPSSESGSQAGEVTEGETERQPTVSQKDYGGAEFTAIYCADTFNVGYFFINEEDRQAGSDMDDAVYERMLAVNEWLGVEIIAENGGNYTEYTNSLKTSISSGDDSYQMVMTHVYQEVASLITSNYLRDFNDFESINMEADYWNSQLMEQLSINDKMYCGYNDFCLANCYLVAFNKDMVKEYAGTIGDLYEQVSNQEWTLEKFISYSALVSRDNGDGVWDESDIYGFSGFAWVPFISFQTGCDIPIVKTNADGELYISPMEDDAEKIVALDEMLYEFANAEYTYTNDPFSGKPALDITSGRAMFSLMNNYGLITTKEEKIPVGVLPYPKWDEAQEDYKTLNWNGVLGIPTTVKNVDMVGDAIEMLAFYSDDVTTAFYETLLGAKVAEAPQDVEMLDIIWRTQVSDIGLVFSNVSSSLDAILYAIPHHISAGKPAYSTYHKQNKKAAQCALNDMFEEK